MMSVKRLHKYMAECGVASRRKCEDLIRGGKVRVNGRVVTEMGVKIDDRTDDVRYNGRRLNAPAKKYYIVNKPEGYITSNNDPGGRKVVFDLLPSGERLFAVGRLDRDTEGLIILTNDGDFANSVAHPSNQVGKSYEVTTRETPDARQLKLLSGGMVVDGYKTSRARVKVLRESRRRTVTGITICEGRNRQIRKMFSSAGLTVTKLKRTAIGGYRNSKLKPGSFRELSKDDLDRVLGKRGKT